MSENESVETLVEIAKLAENAERYEDMAEVYTVFLCVCVCRERDRERETERNGLSEPRNITVVLWTENKIFPL